MHEWTHCHDEAANHQLLTAAGPCTLLCGFCRGRFKLNTKFDADLLLYSLSHFECDDHTVLMLPQQHLLSPQLVQWSCHCSRMSIPVPSPWLPGYINVVQTIVILTIAGLFLDRLCILRRPIWTGTRSLFSLPPLTRQSFRLIQESEFSPQYFQLFPGIEPARK